MLETTDTLVFKKQFIFVEVLGLHCVEVEGKIKMVPPLLESTCAS